MDSLFTSFKRESHIHQLSYKWFVDFWFWKMIQKNKHLYIVDIRMIVLNIKRKEKKGKDDIYSRLSITWCDGDFQLRIANLEGGHRGYGQVDLPKVNITWSLSLDGNWTPIAEFASRIEYHYTTDPQKKGYVYYNKDTFSFSC